MLHFRNLHLAAASAVAIAASVIFPVHSEACTGISFVSKDGSHVLARSIEWAAERLDSRYVIMPRGYRFQSFTPDGTDGMEYVAKYGFAGVSVMVDELMVEGMNEKGLSAGLFFFPEYGSYKPFNPAEKSSTLSDFQFASWALATCATVDEVIEAAGKIDVTGLSGSIGAVHWRLADRTGRQVILEITDGEMHFFENPVGVLTNSPGFQWHLTNLSNYVNLIPGSAGNKTWTSGDGIYEVKPVSGGSGMLGLPGDYTSPSRFVRIAMFRATAPVPPTAYDAMLQSFKILEAMVIPIGAVVDVNENSEKTLDMITSTQFTTVSDIDNLKFYYRTMDNSMIRCIDFNTIDFRKVKYVSRPLDNVPEQVQMVAVK
ncbi:MAG: choloylglycine hydrolase family protein [Bacteroidales bacterium]|nr:choloylglycine hydrolase family protein [Bacteroidales bacterium]